MITNEITIEQTKSLAELFIGMLEHEYKTTRRVLAAYPEAQLDFKLGEKGRTGRELLWHIIESQIWFGEGICRGDFNFHPEPQDVPATLAEMLAWHDDHVPAMLARLKALPPEHLAKVVSFFGAYNMPLVYYLNFSNIHTVHHRGQLSAYIRALNGRVPDIYGGSADEPFQMPQQ